MRHPTLWACAMLVVAALTTGFAAPEPTEAQLEYSKQLYAEGEAAMEAGNYDEAFIKFQDGYRYAPNLHIFTLNIATAADEGGNCSAARTWYQRFLDLVPDHDERGSVQKRLDELKDQCEPLGVLQPTFKVEKPVATTPKGRKSRNQVEAELAFNQALEELMTARVLYQTNYARHKQTKELNRAARRKKRQSKRMRKLLDSHGVDATEPEIPKPEASKTAKDACREARAMENRVNSALEAVLKWYGTAEAARVLKRFMWFSDRIDRPRFEECS